MNVNNMLDYRCDPTEDYYAILGCDKSSSQEQISTEFKIRAKECHPDKVSGSYKSNPERFQVLLRVSLCKTLDIKSHL